MEVFFFSIFRIVALLLLSFTVVSFYKRIAVQHPRIQHFQLFLHHATVSKGYFTGADFDVVSFREGVSIDPTLQVFDKIPQYGVLIPCFAPSQNSGK